MLIAVCTEDINVLLLNLFTCHLNTNKKNSLSQTTLTQSHVKESFLNYVISTMLTRNAVQIHGNISTTIDHKYFPINGIYFRSDKATILFSSLYNEIAQGQYNGTAGVAATSQC